MAGVVNVQTKMSIASPNGLDGPLEVLGSSVATVWFGPSRVSVPTATTEQSLVVIGTQGLTTITDIMITSDQAISVTYGVAANNVPVPLAANKAHLISGTSLTALSISNDSGSTANVTYMVGGA